MSSRTSTQEPHVMPSILRSTLAVSFDAFESWERDAESRGSSCSIGSLTSDVLVNVNRELAIPLNVEAISGVLGGEKGENGERWWVF